MTDMYCHCGIEDGNAVVTAGNKVKKFILA